MSFKCEKCGSQREYGEKQHKLVLETREVEYTNFSEGLRVESRGTEIVKEISVGACCNG